MEKNLRLIDHLRYHRDLILGKAENKELVIASRANIAGMFSLAVVAAGVINGRLDMATIGATLMIASGGVMLHAVRRS